MADWCERTPDSAEGLPVTQFQASLSVEDIAPVGNASSTQLTLLVALLVVVPVPLLVVLPEPVLVMLPEPVLVVPPEPVEPFAAAGGHFAGLIPGGASVEEGRRPCRSRCCL